VSGAVRTPLVALPSYRLPPGRVTEWEDGAFALPGAYAAAVRRAGGIPVAVAPPGGVTGDGIERESWAASPDAAELLVSRFDALVLTGGGDVDPASYGAERKPEVEHVDAGRDGLETSLAAAAARRGVPTLAICRGMQVLNVALGGTLQQDLPEAGKVDHGRREQSVHEVTALAGSVLAKACGESISRCISRHHQGVDRLAPGLVAVGWSGDGLVEAVECPDASGWVLGVQWHPERSAAEDPVQQSLFDALLEQARGTAPP
jgi:putative glutamine amidotransferase